MFNSLQTRPSKEAKAFINDLKKVMAKHHAMFVHEENHTKVVVNGIKVVQFYCVSSLSRLD